MHILSAFAEWIGKPDRADTPSFATNPVHLSHLNARVGLISEALTATRPIPQSKDLGVLACRLVQSIRCMPFWCRSCRTAWAGSMACCDCAAAHKIGCRCLLGLCGFYGARLRAQSLETPRPSCGLLYLQAVPPQTYWFGQWRQRDRAYLHLCAFGNDDMEMADGISFEPLSFGLVAFHIRQSGNPMPL